MRGAPPRLYEAYRNIGNYAARIVNGAKLPGEVS